PVKIGRPDGNVNFRRAGGHPRSLKRETGVRPMNATIRSEKIESTEVDRNLAAFSEVEAAIRDFVRNDIAYLRRPAPGIQSSGEATLEPKGETTRPEVKLEPPP